MILWPDNLTVRDTGMKNTDAMATMIGNQAFHAVTFDGARYDCGSKAGYIQANLAVALSRPDMADEVRAMARRLVG